MRTEARVFLMMEPPAAVGVCLRSSAWCTIRARRRLTDGDGDAQEGRGDRRLRAVGAPVVRLEERNELLLQLGALSVLLGGVERVHRGSVVLAERIDELRGRSSEIEGVGVAQERHVLLRNAGGAKALEDVALDAPRHRAHEARGRWRGMR